jgi:hypothetical protein
MYLVCIMNSNQLLKTGTVWTGIKLLDWVNTDPQQDILVLEENYTN